MGLFDHLFKPRPEGHVERVVEAPLKASGLVEKSGASGGRADARSRRPLFFSPRATLPAPAADLGGQNQGFVPVLPGAEASARARAANPLPAEESRAEADEIVLTVGDVLPRIPVAFLRPGPHDLKRELRFHIDASCFGHHPWPARHRAVGASPSNVPIFSTARSATTRTWRSGCRSRSSSSRSAASAREGLRAPPPTAAAVVPPIRLPVAAPVESERCRRSERESLRVMSEPVPVARESIRVPLRPRQSAPVAPSRNQRRQSPFGGPVAATRCGGS